MQHAGQVSCFFVSLLILCMECKLCALFFWPWSTPVFSYPAFVLYVRNLERGRNFKWFSSHPRRNTKDSGVANGLELAIISLGDALWNTKKLNSVNADEFCTVHLNLEVGTKKPRCHHEILTKCLDHSCRVRDGWRVPRSRVDRPGSRIGNVRGSMWLVVGSRSCPLASCVFGLDWTGVDRRFFFLRVNVAFYYSIIKGTI
jgi:hypothetical protein